MTSSRISRAIAVSVFTATVILGSPGVQAAQRVDDPRDPIVRFVKLVKKILNIVVNEDQPQPPHP